MGRFLVLLLLAVALTTPTTGRARADTLVNAEAAVAVQFAAPSAKRRALPCRGPRKGCGMLGIACSAHCAAPPAILPVAQILAAITAVPPASSVTAALRTHHRLPDPGPPRPIVIS